MEENFITGLLVAYVIMDVHLVIGSVGEGPYYSYELSFCLSGD